MNRFVMLCLGLLLPPIAAEAQETVAFKCPVPGTRMTFPNNSYITFTRQEGHACYFTRNADTQENGWLGGLLNPTSRIGSQMKGDVEKLWPAKIGAKSEFIQIESLGYQFAVKERKMLTVRAGTFDVLVLEASWEGIRQNFHKSTHRYYYAIDLGYPVKYEPLLERGNFTAPVPTAWEAAKISKP